MKHKFSLQAKTVLLIFFAIFYSFTAVVKTNQVVWQHCCSMEVKHNHMAKTKKAAKKASTKKNKLGVKNSLVNNINARKQQGISRPKSKKTVSKKSYEKMEEGWKE